MAAERDDPAAEVERERDFWGHHVASAAEVLAEVEAGPDPNTKAMLDAVEPLAGKRVLDFACGTGATTAWLALRGAHATGLDITAECVDVAREVSASLGVKAEFVTSALDEFLPQDPFDAIVGRYALHHVDIRIIAPLLARLLAPGGTSAFVETMATNPVLRFARKWLTGRFGVPRYGTPDEHPLTVDDVAELARHLGEYTDETRHGVFLQILDRQLLRYRWPALSRGLGAADTLLLSGPRRCQWSYQQVLTFRSSQIVRENSKNDETSG